MQPNNPNQFTEKAWEAIARTPDLVKQGRQQQINPVIFTANDRTQVVANRIERLTHGQQFNDRGTLSVACTAEATAAPRHEGHTAPAIRETPCRLTLAQKHADNTIMRPPGYNIGPTRGSGCRAVSHLIDLTTQEMRLRSLKRLRGRFVHRSRLRRALMWSFLLVTLLLAGGYYYISRPERLAAIAGELLEEMTGATAHIDRASIGRIELKDSFSLIEVPAADVERIATALNGITIRRKRLAARPDRGQTRDRPSPRDRSAPRKSPTGGRPPRRNA